MREVIVIDTTREGYSPDQVCGTMAVAELIATLEKYDEDTPVYLGFDNRYTYGGIRERNFDIKEIEED